MSHAPEHAVLRLGLRYALSALLALALLQGVLQSHALAESEPVDKTRLDVERLPPEAIASTRDMYATGLHLQAELGGQSLLGGAGRISLPGPSARVGIGYELTRWFALSSLIGLGLHATDAPSPPSVSPFQLYSVLAQAKFQLSLGARSAVWLAGEGGMAWASGDFLQAWGYRNAGNVGAAYGGSVGFDWHLRNAHHALGLRAGALLLPNLNGLDGESALAVDVAAYLKYVF